MLVYSDSAADKEIIHLSVYIKSEKIFSRKDSKYKKHLQYKFVLKKVL